MGRNPDGSITISTLGDHREFGYTLTAYCETYGCRRALSATLDDLIRIFGADWPITRQKPPIKCVECGGRDISWIMSPKNTTGQATPAPRTGEEPAPHPEHPSASATPVPRSPGS